MALQPVQPVGQVSAPQPGTAAIVAALLWHVATPSSEVSELRAEMENVQSNLQSKVESAESNLQSKVEGVESKVGRVESKVESVESNLQSVESKVDAMAGDVAKIMQLLQHFE